MDVFGTYPDGPPVLSVENDIHALNLESFPSDDLARVDNVLVYALFASKGRWHSWKAINLDGVGQLACTYEEGVQIARLVNDKSRVTRAEPTRLQCAALAQLLVLEFPNVFCEQERCITEQ